MTHTPPEASTTSSSAYVPHFVQRPGGIAPDAADVGPSPAEPTSIAPELMTQVMTLEAANEARRVIADARRRLAEIAARAPQAALVRTPDEAPPARPAPPSLTSLPERKKPPTLHGQASRHAPRPAQVQPVRQTPPGPQADGARQAPPTVAAEPALQTPPAPQAVSTRVAPPALLRRQTLPALQPVAPAIQDSLAIASSRATVSLPREYQWEQMVKAPYERAPVPAAPSAPSAPPEAQPAERPSHRGRSGSSREYVWEQAVKAPYQPPPVKPSALSVFMSLKSAAFGSPSPDRRTSLR